MTEGVPTGPRRGEVKRSHTVSMSMPIQIVSSKTLRIHAHRRAEGYTGWSHIHLTLFSK